MAHEIKIKDLVFAEDSYYKTQRVKIGSKSFVTPIKAIDLRKNITGVGVNSSIRGVNEVYRIFNSKSLTNVQTTNREQVINNEINRLFKKYSSEDDVNICFTEFEDLKIPNEDEIEYLTNLSYVHSDITPLPLLPKVAKNITSDTFNEYNTFVKNAIETIDVLNNKPIMGIIPMAIPSAFMPTLLNTYLDNGITALCLDFQGSTVGSSLTKIRALVKSMKKQKLLEKSFIYSINLGAGKLPKSKEVVPAKDILSFGYGFDTIGGQHIRKRLPPEVRAKILSAKNMFENSLRLFNKKNYGYYRATKKETVKEIYPEDSSIPLEVLEKIKTHPNIDKLFNQEQQGFEAVNLRVIIKEEQKLLSYLDKKEYVEVNDIKALENIKKRK
jgi:hypothetical protein